MLAVLFPQLCFYMQLTVLKRLILTGLECKVMVLCANSYKDLYDSALLYFSVLCSGFSVLLSLSILEAIFRRFVKQLFSHGIK